MARFFFGSKEQRLAAAGLWPKARIISALKRRYRAVDDLGDDNGFSLYGVTDGEIRFAVALALAAGAGDRVTDVGFLARFTGFSLSDARLEALNRNLHISVASFHTDGDLYLIGGVAAAGEFNDGTFALVLEAWKRDLLVILHAMSLAPSYVEAFPAARLEAVRRFAVNRASDGESAARDLFASFAGGDHRRMSLCAACGGRGKTGLIARSCDACAGSGFCVGANSRS